MPEDSPKESFFRNGAECAAVDTGGMRPPHLDHSGGGVDTVDPFYQGTIVRVTENYHVTRTGTAQDKGDSRYQNEITVQIIRIQGATGDPNQPTHAYSTGYTNSKPGA